MSSVAGFHLHFYQPPRENPWLGVVPNEWSAWPYHDWNERITVECYRAMIAVALSRSDDGETELFEPLRATSFDVGPTLHQWIERYAPDVDQALAAQVRNAANPAAPVAIAAPYVHAIMPLALPEDRERLVAWGIADFTRRFGERPLAMWLPETAVDAATLEVLARQGIRYTILMPGQAARVRSPDGDWSDVDAQSLDTSRPYVVRLGEGRSINVVFGHNDLSRQVAFGDLVDDGAELADTMMSALGDDHDGAVVLVTDGETFGHHHRFGDVGMSWALRRLQRHYGVETSVGAWLATQEPTFELELAPVSSWSCAHGVERWRSACGCVTGSQPGWRQDWRKPLRESLDWLRHSLGAAVDRELAVLVVSPDVALLAYGTVLTGTVAPAQFVRDHQLYDLNDDERSRVLELCEIHRNLLYSFTSCAWFFADPAEIETAIVLRYATVALELAQRTLGVDLEKEFLARVDGVHSNRPGVEGREIWRRARATYRFDESLVVAGFAAERLAVESALREERGFWSLEVQPSRDDDEGDTFRVALTHRATLRRREYVARARRNGDLGASVKVRAVQEQRWTDYVLGDLGADVIALVAASWLVAPGSVDYEVALNRLVAELLARPAGVDDAAVLHALASATRCATPATEVAIQRALIMIAGHAQSLDGLSLLVPLARAVGLGELVGVSRAPHGAN